MDKKFRVAVVGTGAMGSLIAKAAIDKGIEIVGAFDCDKALIGKDLGDVIGIRRKLGVRIDGNLQNLRNTNADVALYATVASLKGYLPQILPAMKAHMKIISTNEELCFPWHLTEAEEIDRYAKKYGVTVFGAGVNPGFTADVLPVVLSSVCHQVDKVEVKRIVDISPYSMRDMKMWGIGLSLDKWKELERKKAVGQIGMKGSAYYIADCLGVKLDEMLEEIKPFVAKVRRKGDYVTVEPGKVAWFEQKVTGTTKRKEFVSFTMVGDLDPRAEKINEPGVSIHITGKPNINVEFKGTSLAEEGALATTGRIVNMIPVIMEAKAGLITQNDVPVGPCKKHLSISTG